MARVDISIHPAAAAADLRLGAVDRCLYIPRLARRTLLAALRRPRFVAAAVEFQYNRAMMRSGVRENLLPSRFCRPPCAYSRGCVTLDLSDDRVRSKDTPSRSPNAIYRIRVVPPLLIFSPAIEHESRMEFRCQK